MQVENVDITQKPEVESFFTKLTLPVECLFHAAGVLQFHDTISLTWSEFDQTLATKGRGTFNILSCVSKPKRVVLFSSAGAVFGLGNSIHYAAADALQEATASNFPNLPIQCIAWD